MNDPSILHDDDSHYLSQLAALSLWAQQRFEPPIGGKINDRLKKFQTKENAGLLSKAFVICCLGHLRVLSALVDGAFVKSLVYSYFENEYKEASVALSIFLFIRSRFMILPDLEQYPTYYSRGRLILQLLRCLHLHKGCSQTLTLLYVCACRCYGLSARLVNGVSSDTLALFAEVFDPESGSWKRVDFTNNTFNGTIYDPNKWSRSINKERTVTSYNAAPETVEHRGYLYVQRQNKLFVYRKGDNLTVVAILLFREGWRNKVVLNVTEFPFETEQVRLRLLQAKEKPGPNTTRVDYRYVFGCNRFGWLSELTPKYVERFNDVCIKRGRVLHEWITQSINNLNDSLRNFPKASLVSLLERAEAKWMDVRVSNDPLPTHKSKFKNHPMYVLASQIGNNRIKKKNVTPIAYLKGEEVFLRSDFEDLKTRSGWLKVNRRVMETSLPITTRMVYNRNLRCRVQSCLFSESQTVAVPPQDLSDGQIPTTEYNNIDATGEKFIPHGTIYLRAKKPELLFETVKAMKLYHKRAFSSYQKNDSMKPEIDGIVIRKSDLPAFLKKYEEMAIAKSNAAYEETKNSYRSYWRSVFKTMLADPPTVAQEQHRKIRKELDAKVSRFLNRLEHIR